MGPTADSDEVPSLAQRLDKLFKSRLKTTGPDEGREYSHREVARILTDAGEPISHAYIGQLRDGTVTDPRLSHLRALAGFFGVPVEYFTSTALAEEVDHELDLVAKLRELKVHTVALRQSVLPEAMQSITALQNIVDAIRTLEAQQDSGEQPRDDA